jgi:hypothetical protein
VESSAVLANAHRELNERRDEFGLTSLELISEISSGQSFLICDLDRNWWEVAHLNN